MPLINGHHVNGMLSQSDCKHTYGTPSSKLWKGAYKVWSIQRMVYVLHKDEAVGDTSCDAMVLRRSLHPCGPLCKLALTYRIRD
jgi:hypothetical protein